ncbi:hypothetical protein [Floridanema aerugineum]|uniref:Uncharacterized protein n=1 Tax=Floridaenema aerugineum BLCC-F46 TaxID=3153654 RepID=A0ABV4X346_9CYAN
MSVTVALSMVGIMIGLRDILARSLYITQQLVCAVLKVEPHQVRLLSIQIAAKYSIKDMATNSTPE